MITKNFISTVLSVILSFSTAQAVEIFSVTATSNTFPVAQDVTAFNNGDFDSNAPDPTVGYSADDTEGANGSSGSGWGNAISTNFSGVTADDAINNGDQSTSSGTNGHTTTYMGPTVYAGSNRDDYRGAAGIIHANGNGYRIRMNNVSQAQVNALDATDRAANSDGLPNITAAFMFDVDTSLLGAGESFSFFDGDLITALLAVPNNAGGPSGGRAFSASYRALVRANGTYYAGDIYNVVLSDLSGASGSSATFDMSDNAGTTNWIEMPNFESTNNQASINGPRPTNLVVDETGTTVVGTSLTNITHVGFLLDTTSNVQTGGYNFGVRSLTANATAVPEPKAYALIVGCLVLSAAILRRRQS